MSRYRLILAGATVAAGAVWYGFRPERLFIDRRVAEAVPAGAAEVPSAGTLTGAFHSNAHRTSGMATVFQLADGRWVLRLADFATSDGPDVRVYLVAARDVTDNQTVGQVGFIDLGAMKGNIGDQNYDIPASADLSLYRAVTIWCRRFSVNFGTAPLT